MRALLTVLVLTLSAASQASEIGAVRAVGVGVVGGDPTGLSVKAYLHERLHALELTAGVDPLGYRSLYLHAQYLVHPVRLADGYRAEMPLVVGVGGFVGSVVGPTPIRTLWEDVEPDPWEEASGVLGARATLGLDLDLKDLPLQLSLSAGLNLVLAPTVEPTLSVGLGARYYP